MFASTPLDCSRLVSPRRTTARINAADIFEEVRLGARPLHLESLAVLKIRHHSAFSIQFANPHVPKAHRVAMILQIERSLLGKTVERSRRRAFLSDRNMVLNQDPIMQHGK